MLPSMVVALVGLALALGVLAFGALVWIWTAPGSDAFWGGGFIILLTAPLALVLGILGLGAALDRKPRSRGVLAAGVLAVCLAAAGVGYLAGGLPREWTPRALEVHVVTEEPANGTVTLTRDGSVRAELAFDLEAGGVASLQTAPLAPGPYQLKVRLGGGRAGAGIVGIGVASGAVLVDIGPEAIDIRQTHGD